MQIIYQSYKGGIFILNRIPNKIFEVAGSLVGGAASLLIMLQIIMELQNKKSSTLSPLYVLGFLFIYIFGLYTDLNLKEPHYGCRME